MPELISESITPHAGTFDATAMGTGRPGLPTGFSWRDESFEITEVRSEWKESSREGSQAQGELYLRRHYFVLLMSDGSLWTVYFIRQAFRASSPKKRWFLYTREATSDETAG